MIQFNLLPDVKIEFIKAVHFRRMVTVIASGVTALALIVTIGLFLLVNVAQKQHLSNLNRDIAVNSKKLEETPDLDKILTIQNQLSSLTPLHEDKAALSRLKIYLAQVTPAQVSYSKITIKVTDKAVSFNGSADSLKTVNQFVDTLKFTKFKVDQEEEKNAFSDVVLTSFGRDEKDASYQLDFVFDEAIFDNTKNVTLVVPNIVTTRSVQQKPDTEGLFQPLSDPENKLQIPEEVR